MKILFKNLIWVSTLLLVQFVIAQERPTLGSARQPVQKPVLHQGGQPAVQQPVSNIGVKAISVVPQSRTSKEMSKNALPEQQTIVINSISECLKKLQSDVQSNRNEIAKVLELCQTNNATLMVQKGNNKRICSPFILSMAILVILVVGVLLLVMVGVVLIKMWGLSKNVGSVNGVIEEKLNAVENLLTEKCTELEQKIASLEGMPREINLVKDKVIKQADKFNSFDFSRLSRLDDMGRKINDVDVKLVSLQMAFSTLGKKDEEIGTLRKENERLKVEQTEAMSKKRAAERLMQDVELEKKKAADTTRLSLQATLNESEKKVTAANDAVKKMQDQIHELNGLVLSLKEQLSKAEQTGYEKAYLKSSEELRKALADSERKLEDLGVVKEQLRLAKESVAQSASEHRSVLAAKEQAHAADLVQKLAAQESKMKSEAESAKTFAVQAEQRKSAATIENLNAEVAARDGKIGDLMKAIVQKETELASVTAAYSKKKDELETMTKSREEVQTKLESLQSTLYPAALIDDPDFAPLRQMLDGWLKQKYVGGEITKAALGLFASRDALDADGWRTALFNLSLGVSSAARASGASPDQVIAELRRWQGFLTKFRDEQHDFQLQLPVLGSPVDASWMTAKNKGASRVANVLSWAIFNKYGPQNNALVE